MIALLLIAIGAGIAGPAFKELGGIYLVLGVVLLLFLLAATVMIVTGKRETALQGQKIVKGAATTVAVFVALATGAFVLFIVYVIATCFGGLN